MTGRPSLAPTPNNTFSEGTTGALGIENPHGLVFLLTFEGVGLGHAFFDACPAVLGYRMWGLSPRGDNQQEALPKSMVTDSESSNSAKAPDSGAFAEKAYGIDVIE